MVGLGDLPGGNLYSNAWSVSADGLTVVGNSGSAYSNHEAFRWTNADGMVPLGDLPGGSFVSRAAGVSDDGYVIVGYSNSISGDEAFRWTESEGMQGLGDLPGGDFYSIAWDVSADGKIVVGESVSESSLKEAFIWDMDSGMVNLNDLLINEYDIDLTGWILHESKGISADGLTIVGKGTNPYGNYEAWIATIPGSDCPYEIPGDSNGDCCVNILDLAILCSHWLNCNLMPESACWK